MPTDCRFFRLPALSTTQRGAGRFPLLALLGALTGTLGTPALAQEEAEADQDASVEGENTEASDDGVEAESVDDEEAAGSEEIETSDSEASEELEEPEVDEIQASATDDAGPSSTNSANERESGPGADQRSTFGELPPADERATEEAARAALVDAPDPGPSLLPLDLTTSTWSRFEMRENFDDLGVARGRFQEGDIAVFRARLGMGTNPLPIADGSDVIVQFTPQASGLWGVNGTLGEAKVGIFEGYFKIRSKRLDVKVGRWQLAYGDEVVIGALDWHQAGRAFDGILAHYKMDRGYLDLFATQVAEGSPGGGPTFLGGDGYFWGAYLGVGRYFDEDMDLDAYFLVQSQLRQEGLLEPTTGMNYAQAAAHRMTGGLRVKNQVGWFDYRMEAGIQFGSTADQAPDGFMGDEVAAVDTLAYQADLELGVSFPGKLRLAIEGLVASGDNPDTERNEGYDHLYPTDHNFLGLMDIIGARTNIASGNLKLMRPITKSLEARIDGHVFFRMEDGLLGSPELEAGFAGTEINTELKQALGQFASVRGLYGVFIPTSGHYLKDDVAHYVEVHSGVEF